MGGSHRAVTPASTKQDSRLVDTVSKDVDKVLTPASRSDDRDITLPLRPAKKPRTATQTNTEKSFSKVT